MPLTGENRYIVRRGLEQLDKRPRPGVAALLDECGGSAKRMNATTVGFTIAPRINAAGRLGNAELAARLLLSRSLAEAAPLVPMAVEHLNAGMQSNVKGFGLYPGKSHYINGTYFE